MRTLKVTEQPGEQVLQVVAPIEPVPGDECQRRPHDRYPREQGRGGELRVVDVLSELLEAQAAGDSLSLDPVQEPWSPPWWRRSRFKP